MTYTLSQLLSCKSYISRFALKVREDKKNVHGINTLGSMIRIKRDWT